MQGSGYSRRAARRKGCRRNRRINNFQTGGAGEAYTLGEHVAGAPIVNNYGQTIVRFPSCEDAVRPGYLDNAQIKGGLPGFSGGGKRQGRKGRKTRRGSRKMRGGSDATAGFRGVLETGADQVTAQLGGAYTNEMNVMGASKIALMEPSYSGCGAGAYAITNPTSGGVDLKSLITAPAGLVPNPTPGSGDALQKGGKRSRKNRRGNQYGGVGGVDSMYYNAPRAGWTTWPSNAEGGNAGTLADGKTPFLINVPFSAQPVPSPACLKTGGGRKRKTRKSRKGRKSRKSYKKMRGGGSLKEDAFDILKNYGVNTNDEEQIFKFIYNKGTNTTSQNTIDGRPILSNGKKVNLDGIEFLVVGSVNLQIWAKRGGEEVMLGSLSDH